MLARVHCSLNLNTETGRLSARRPNLQNQPALEKDRYKVWWTDHSSVRLLSKNGNNVLRYPVADGKARVSY